MQIEIDDEVFHQQKAYALLSAMQRAFQCRHTIFPQDWDGPHFQAWLQACAAQLGEPDVSDLLQMSLEVGILVASARSVKIVPDAEVDHERKRFSFREFTDFLLQGTYVYVENSRADREFLFSIIFDERIKNDLRETERIGALTFDNCGGITVLANRIDDDSGGRRPLLSMRAIAIFDSDASGPSENDVSEGARTAARACRRHRVQHLRLQRRAIENYMPHASLEDFANEASGDRRIGRLKMARTFKTLTRDQQAYIHMKDGLSADLASSALYVGLSADEKSRLAHGFGPDLAQSFSKPAYVTEERFRASGLDGEIQQISKFLLEYL